MTAHLDGASPDVVRMAIRSRDPFPGCRGFAGSVDGALVRDILGRRPVYYDAQRGIQSWGFCPGAVSEPVLLAPGTRRRAGQNERIWTLPGAMATREGRDPIGRLRRALKRQLQDMQTDRVAVAFSGGVDSAWLAAMLDADCLVGGVGGGRDRRLARRAADAMGLDLREVAIEPADIETAIPTVVAATGRTDPMDLSIAIPLHLVARRAASMGYRWLVVGQGADELFGGYEKVAQAPTDDRVTATDITGARDEVLGTLADQLPRDICAIRAAGVEPVMPYMHDAVIQLGRSLPTDLLVDGYGTRKVALRLAARDQLPHRVAFGEKVAIQYGSLVMRELDRLARQAGFKRRMPNHVQRYVQSILG